MSRLATPHDEQRVTSPPRIGLTTYRERAAWGVWDEPADLLPANYADAIALAGGLPMLLPPAINGDLRGAAAVALDGVHGLVLSGGADVDPAEYGAERSDRTGPARHDRDTWELALAREAVTRDLPMLAICRGMQVLAVALGGTLIQHLPDVVATDAHCPTVGVHGRHEVRLAEGSRLAAILGPVSNTPTYHHQGIDRLPADATATAWTTDGTVEAFELSGQTWATAVQWHPEVGDGEALFAAFVAATRVSLAS